MTEGEVLTKIKDYLQKTIDDNNLQLIKYGSVDGTELATPTVYKGWIPANNQVLLNENNVPGILVGFERGTDEDINPAIIDIKLSFAVYSPGDINNGVPDETGYLDLLHLMTFTRTNLLSKLDMDGAVVQKPYEWYMDEEQPWPIWTGNAKFRVAIESTPTISVLDREEIITNELSNLEIEGVSN